MLVRSLALPAICANLASAAVTVLKTSQPPTGYEVVITYENTTASDVQIARIPHFTNQYRTTYTYSAAFDPHDYKPGDFPGATFDGNVSVFPMSASGNGSFTFTTPLPSGTYQYYFLPDCANLTECVDLGQGVVDPENAPFETIKGSELGSPFQVPYDAEFQYYPEQNLNFDYALPVADQSARGTVKADYYPSPGAVSPSPGLHDFAVYLPPGYTNASTQAPYPILYLSHGGGGSAGDWQNQGYVSNILDRLILEKYIEPTVVVMPAFNGLLNGTDPPPIPTIRENYQQYLFPYITSHYHVTNSSDHRAFAGLSYGSALTYEMYINATDYFRYYGMFSGALLPGHPIEDYVNASMAEANPALLDRGVTVGYGQYDIAFDDTKKLQEALDGIGLKYVNRFVPWGFHAWNLWQDNFWVFGRTTLWKPRPFGDEVGPGQ